MLEARSLAGAQLAASDALRDTVLLILFSLIDVVVVLAGGGSCLSEDRGGGKNERADECESGEFHDDAPVTSGDGLSVAAFAHGGNRHRGLAGVVVI